MPEVPVLELSRRMAREPVLIGFGAFLREQRGTRSLQQIENQAKARGLSLPTSTLQNYEKGIVGAIGRERLQALAAVYGLSFERLLNEYIKNRFSADLFAGCEPTEFDVYPHKHVPYHQDLQWILDRATAERLDMVQQALRPLIQLTEALTGESRTKKELPVEG